MKIIDELGKTVHMAALYLMMSIIITGLAISKKLVGLTGWRLAINVYKWLHICGEILSRHIQKMLPK